MIRYTVTAYHSDGTVSLVYRAESLRSVLAQLSGMDESCKVTIRVARAR